MILLDDLRLMIMGMARVMAYLLIWAPIMACIRLLVRFALIILAAIADEVRNLKYLITESAIPELRLIATRIIIKGGETLNFIETSIAAGVQDLMASWHEIKTPKEIDDLNNNPVVEGGMSNANIIGATTVVLFGAAGIMLAFNKKTNVRTTQIEDLDDIEAQTKSKPQNQKWHLS